MAQRFKAKTLISNSGVFNNELTAPNLVYNTGDQNISGVKNFYSRPTINGTGILISGETAQVDLSSTVRTTGNQTISGFKIFAEDVTLTGTNNRIGKNHYLQTDSDFVFIRDTGNGLIFSSEEYVLFDNSNTISIAFNDRYLANRNGNSILHWTGNNIGIGTNDPSEKLEVVGNVIANNLIYNTGDQTISGQKWFTYDDPTITQYSYNSKYANLTIPEGYGPGVVTFKPVTNYRPFTFGQPSYYYSGIGYETGSVQIYFDTGDSRWKYYFGGLASAFFIGKSPIVTPGGFQAKIPLKGWTDNSNQILDIKFHPQIQHTESHASGEKDALDPSSIGAVAVTGNQSVYGIKMFFSRPTVNGTGVLLSGEAAQVDLTSTVRTTGDQQISGIKTFNDPIYGTTLSGLNLIGGIPTTIGKDILISGGNATSFGGGSISIVGGIGASIYPSGTINLRGSSINITTSTVDFRNSLVANASAGFTNVNSNFTISAAYGSDLVLANSSSQITGTISSGLANGFNVSIHQIGSGQIVITGAGPGVTINSYGNQYKTAGQYAAISLVHTGNNGYLMYGNTAL
jgi:hypothetical protein